MVSVVLYKVLFATFGTDDYTPYRVLVIASHLTVVALVYAYASRRVGSVGALLAATLVLFIGAGWQNILWAFQMAWGTSLAAGIGALLMLDRRDRVGDVGAALLTGLALISSGLGGPIALGIAVDLLWGRRRWRDLWIVVVPLVPYGLWWLGYQDSEFLRHGVVEAPQFTVDAAASALSGLAGLSGEVVADPRAALDWGRPLLIGAAAALLWRLSRLNPIPPRALTLMTILGSFWVLTSIGRSGINPEASRYVYVGGLLIVLLAVELARGVAFSRRVALVTAVVVAAIVVSNVGTFRDAARMLREQGQIARTSLAAVEMTRATVPPDYTPHVPGYPLVQIPVREYFAWADDLGSPAATIPEVAASRDDARRAADSDLRRIHAVGLRPSGQQGPPPESAAPRVDAAAGGAVRREAGCVMFEPAPYLPGEATPSIQLTVPPAGLLVLGDDAPTAVRTRRFSAVFPARPDGRLGPGRSGVLRIGRDLAPQPWHVSLTSAAPVTACGLG